MIALGVEAEGPRRLAGVTALAFFFAFGTFACVTAGALLLFPGTALDGAWSINPRGHEGFLRMGGWAFALLSAVAVACAASFVGLFRRREWGRRLAILVLSVNLVADAANAILAGDPRSWIGVPIAAILIGFLASSGVRRFFAISRAAP